MEHILLEIWISKLLSKHKLYLWFTQPITAEHVYLFMLVKLNFQNTPSADPQINVY